MVLNHDNMMAHKMSCLNTTHTCGKYTHTGPLGLMAQYAGQRGTYASEYTCPLGFRVTHQ